MYKYFLKDVSFEIHNVLMFSWHYIGRRWSPKVPVELRFCRLCYFNLIDDEKHLIFDRPIVTVQRKNYLRNLVWFWIILVVKKEVFLQIMNNHLSRQIFKEIMRDYGITLLRRICMFYCCCGCFTLLYSLTILLCNKVISGIIISNV